MIHHTIEAGRYIPQRPTSSPLIQTLQELVGNGVVTLDDVRRAFVAYRYQCEWATYAAAVLTGNPFTIRELAPARGVFYAAHMGIDDPTVVTTAEWVMFLDSFHSGDADPWWRGDPLCGDDDDDD